MFDLYYSELLSAQNTLDAVLHVGAKQFRNKNLLTENKR